MSSLFKSSAPPPPPPIAQTAPLIMPSSPPPTPAMPDPMSPAARESAINDMANSASGQAGTNLTGKKNKKTAGGTVLGGGSDSYGGTKLGGA